MNFDDDETWFCSWRTPIVLAVAFALYYLLQEFIQ